MGDAFAISWNDSKKGRLSLRLTAALVAVLAALPSGFGAVRPAGERISVIVREFRGSGSVPERAVEVLGGSVGRHIGIIDGFVASLPADRLGRLRATPGVHSVTPDARIRLLHAVDGFDPAADPGRCTTRLAPRRRGCSGATDTPERAWTLR